MKKLMLAIVLFPLFAVSGVQDEIAQLDAKKLHHEENITTKKATGIVPFGLPNGQSANANDYQLVLFMQGHCPFCHQFDPLLQQYSQQSQLKVMAYTLDGGGDESYPNALPAPKEVVTTFFGGGLPMATPTVFLINVNTLKAYPVSQGVEEMASFNRRVGELIVTDSKGGE